MRTIDMQLMFLQNDFNLLQPRKRVIHIVNILCRYRPTVFYPAVRARSAIYNCHGLFDLGGSQRNPII